MSGLDWDILTRYLAGACTPAERGRVERWLAESPLNPGILDDFRSAAAVADETASPNRQAEILASLQGQWGAMPGAAAADSARLRQVGGKRATPTFSLPASRWRVTATIAASIALVGVGGAIGAGLLRQARTATTVAPHPTVTTVATARGERRSLRLPDGTLVALAPASSLRFPSSYGARDRMVELAGEAVFSVVHDSSRPFAVRTARAVARDLGTRFAVRAYPDDPVTDVVVAEGLVAVARGATAGPAAQDSMVVTRGERARVASDGGLMLSRGVSLERYFGWTEGRLVFQDAPLSEAAAQLGRWYAIDVRLESPGIAARRLTALFRDESAPEALRVVASVLNLDVTQAGNLYTLRSK